MRGAVGVLALGCALTSACSRGDDQPKVVDIRPPFARVDSVSDAGGAGRGEAPHAPRAVAKDEPWPGDVDAAAAGPYRMMIMRTITVEAGTKGAPAPPLNPDDAILERVRMAAGGCFASLPAGNGLGPPERSAHISLTVIPTGSVLRADVTSADTTDEGVLGCIRQEALRTAFSDNAGGPLRTYAIDVRVFAKGNGGGR